MSNEDSSHTVNEVKSLYDPVKRAEEVARIRAALERAHYRREEAASLLGMSRTTLWRKMKQYRL